MRGTPARGLLESGKAASTAVSRCAAERFVSGYDGARSVSAIDRTIEYRAAAHVRVRSDYHAVHARVAEKIGPSNYSSAA